MTWTPVETLRCCIQCGRTLQRSMSDEQRRRIAIACGLVLALAALLVLFAWAYSTRAAGAARVPGAATAPSAAPGIETLSDGACAPSGPPRAANPSLETAARGLATEAGTRVVPAQQPGAERSAPGLNNTPAAPLSRKGDAHQGRVLDRGAGDGAGARCVVSRNCISLASISLTRTMVCGGPSCERKESCAFVRNVSSNYPTTSFVNIAGLPATIVYNTKADAVRVKQHVIGSIVSSGPLGVDGKMKNPTTLRGSLSALQQQGQSSVENSRANHANYAVSIALAPTTNTTIPRRKFVGSAALVMLRSTESTTGPSCPPSRLLNAIRLVESGGVERPRDGDGGRAIGEYQIWKSYWQDSRVPGSYQQCRDRAYAETVILAYWRRWCPQALEAGDWRTLAMVHHYGPSGATCADRHEYWAKVKSTMAGGGA